MKYKIYILTFFITLISCSENSSATITEQNQEIPSVKKEETYDVIVTKDIVYAEGLSHTTINGTTTSTKQLKLDAYVPNNSDKNRPAIVLIHGGGFSSGSKEVGSMVYLANYFAARGWVAFSINYRLEADLGTVPDAWVPFAQNNLDPSLVDQFFALYPASRDAKAAIRWLYANASNYNINTDYITVGGGSAGAVTATMLGATNAEDYTEEISLEKDPTLATTNLDQPTKVHTVLDFWGSGITVEILDDLYNRQRFDTTDAPIIIMHGTEDLIVSFSDAEKLKNNYENSGVPFEFYPLEGKGHSVWNATVNGKRLEVLSFDFIVEQQKLKIE
ncbi:alpha/beta hydrolase [Tenacibaculum jejuense]|uniref:Probable lipoprotein. Esterase/lipase family protein n=1 Tax=Tenacibaculum jejuense TaxID=584609 RepID=A0A238U5R7_9FLAO|nr:alpha/beta hydrolase [Tenacibaculum jejuense]SNR13834.1 Probable lipoprotein precursor. Esterase/lipase family protein [Tenacibaculum jejuense]